MVDYKEMFERLDIEWPNELLFIGSGTTPTPKEWLTIPSIRTNARTLGHFPSNEVHTIITWPSMTEEGLCGVLNALNRYDKGQPNIIVFDNMMDEAVMDQGKLTLFGTRNRFDSPVFAPYVKHTNDMGYIPKNSTGFYMILWLLYAPVDTIYISGCDGWMGLTGDEYGEWDVDKVYHDIDGREWCPVDNAIVRSGDKEFAFHNLHTEWLAIEDAIVIAKDRGVNVVVSKGVK